ncbi:MULTISPECIES: transcription elongation factor GreB [Commensalibacter]|uniref:Transcription elongation factor GreB n=2 Tax=Commensalibacter TaxID=1079922 RepID=W7DXW8_9PROT|nr:MULTISPECIES: transcription elongation factor GreB [Commensalibacter]EUK19058.1 transcription elongation factor GreB [Commensalibacter papalotli (ex Servin-Garciduenas et al. 2014)]CAI3923299.1 GreA/GreB family (GreA) (PDB:1GRJ) [Commensalibacter papalotli (ex Botero et al. 2024)]CAI3928738.1 GreA/GreB family (GreA) (PDB:1GRJ) [Commensalibacter papalotli (ex Botero et al. 2024)]
MAVASQTPPHLTPQGFDRLKDELNSLLHKERPKIVEIVSWAAGNGDRSENGDYIYGKRRLREIDRRVRFLLKRLDNAVVVDPKEQPQKDKVYFGATVTYVTEEDQEYTVTIVGVDEAITEQGQISLISPIARALIKSKVGDEVKYQSPAGEKFLEILEIAYPS